MNILNKITGFNNTLAVKTTIIVSTMWCFYVFLLFSFVPVFAPSIQNFALYWSNVFQLIFLPLIMVGQSLLNKNSEDRAAADHAAIMAEVADMQEIIADDANIVTVLADIHTKIAAIEAKLT